MCGHDYSHHIVSNTVCLYFALSFLYWVLLLQCHHLEMSKWKTHSYTFSKWNLHWSICSRLYWYISALFFQFQVWFGTYQVFYSESDFALYCWKLCPSYIRDSAILEYNFLGYSCISHWDLLRTGSYSHDCSWPHLSFYISVLMSGFSEVL